jgi:hypothetical protein
VRILDGSEVLAKHERCWGRRQLVEDVVHRRDGLYGLQGGYSVRFTTLAQMIADLLVQVRARPRETLAALHQPRHAPAIANRAEPPAGSM